MKKIDIRTPVGNKLRICSYGQSRTGKSRFAGSWPKPIFLSDATEGGWQTLQYMSDEVFYEPGVFPDVVALESAADMITALNELKETVAKNPGKYETVVIDSLTFYADTYFAALERAAIERAGGKRPDTRQLYQDLHQHLRWLAIEVHKLPLNVVWLCLEKAPTDDHPIGTISVPGGSAEKFPARCDYLLYHRAYQINPTQGPIYEIRTRKFGQYTAGGRDEGVLPDPLTECTYRELAGYLGIIPMEQEEEKGQSAPKVMKIGKGK